MRNYILILFFLSLDPKNLIFPSTAKSSNAAEGFNPGNLCLADLEH